METIMALISERFDKLDAKINSVEKRITKKLTKLEEKLRTFSRRRTPQSTKPVKTVKTIKIRNFNNFLDTDCIEWKRYIEEHFSINNDFESVHPL